MSLVGKSEKKSKLPKGTQDKQVSTFPLLFFVLFCSLSSSQKISSVMKTLVVFLLLGVSYMIAHDVVGLIINDTEFFYILTENVLSHGKAKHLPATRLAPFARTNFTLESTVGVIKYNFGYTPETDWCSEVRAGYSYGYGSSGCDCDPGPLCSKDDDDRVVYLSLCPGVCESLWGGVPRYAIVRRVWPQE